LSSKCFGNNARLRRLLIVRQFVGLSCNDHVRYAQSFQPLEQLQIKLRRGHSCVDQLNGQNDGRTTSKVSLDKQLPPLDFELTCFRITKSGQIDKKERFINPVEIDGLRFPGGRTGSGKILFSYQAVNKTRFSNIGSSCKNNFRNPFVREITFRDGAYDKIGLGHRRSCGSAFSALRSRWDEDPQSQISVTPVWGQAAFPRLSAGLHPWFQPNRRSEPPEFPRGDPGDPFHSLSAG
jgi:hypothetical protein